MNGAGECERPADAGLGVGDTGLEDAAGRPTPLY
jgi:hypothetical protein